VILTGNRPKSKIMSAIPQKKDGDIGCSKSTLHCYYLVALEEFLKVKEII